MAFDLTSSANALASQLSPVVRTSVGELVRSMNCYYSNLIEGHNTVPRDIERALAHEYASEPTRRNLQLEAVAHVQLQRKIDLGADPPDDPVSISYIRWLHREFCSLLPLELLWVENPDTGERLCISPGEIRTQSVKIGFHVPPSPDELVACLERFEEAYSGALSKVRRVIAVAASHHRLLWIHPFLDGNGRVARLMAHALLRRLNIGNSLWSVSRGLARHVSEYKSLLMAADNPRQNDYDGRGNLSERALFEFCVFFLRVCMDQVQFMQSLLDPGNLLRRIELFCRDEVEAGRLPKLAYQVLREAVLQGEVDRGHVPSLIGLRERAARNVTAALIAKGLLTSETPKGPLRLAFPTEAVERWFPALYPGTGPG
ncbi:MAG: Fic family protein [Acidobacteriaceae bacterium]|nr:Fic family protein [Acidobacteriaceae bacterium]